MDEQQETIELLELSLQRFEALEAEWRNVHDRLIAWRAEGEGIAVAHEKLYRQLADVTTVHADALKRIRNEALGEGWKNSLEDEDDDDGEAWRESLNDDES